MALFSLAAPSILQPCLSMALAVYEQERTDFNAQQIVTNQVTNTEGPEFVARWVPTDNLVLTLGYSNMEVVNLTTLNSGGNFTFFGAADIPQIDPAVIYGGQVIGVPAANSENDARRAGIPVGGTIVLPELPINVQASVAFRF